jgi:hypothetical protein
METTTSSAVNAFVGILGACDLGAAVGLTRRLADTVG